MNEPKCWFVTADNRAAKLFRCRRTPGGQLNILQDDILENTHEDEHEHHRPSLLGGSERRGSVGSSAAAAAPHTVSRGHDAEEETERFAREIKTWIGHACRDKSLDSLVVFAAPRLLGHLRGQLDAHTQLHEGELATLSTQQLAAHPAVRSALEWAGPGTR